MKALLSLIAVLGIVAIFQNCAAPKGLKRLTSNFNSSLSLSSTTSSGELVEILKTRGCMLDSLVYPAIGDYADSIELLNRSSCVALPRVIETWTNPPKFDESLRRIQEIEALTGRTFIYGMFIAEAISTVAVYSDDQGGTFDFASMCHAGTLGQWGADTCVPNGQHPEFLRYVRFIVGKALDIGIRDILFGQLGHIDRQGTLGALIEDIREMARARGVSIIVGGQPNGIMPETFLKKFDYIITPAYIDEDVSQKCLSRITAGCQAIYFHPELENLANNVVVEIDWSGPYDDIHNLAKKPPAERREYIYKRYKELQARGIGFVLPFRIWYDGGSTVQCKGFNQYVYSASTSFECKDETAWNLILQGKDPSSTYTNDQVPAQPVPVDTNTPMTLASARQIVKNAMINVMGRTAAEVDGDPSGMEFWVQQVMAGTTASQLNAHIAASDEYRVRGYYLTHLRRRADMTGLMYYLTELRAGRITLDYIRSHFIEVCTKHVDNECR